MSAKKPVKQLIIKAARLRREAADDLHINDEENQKLRVKFKRDQLHWALQSENQWRVNAALAALESMPQLAASINEWDKDPMTAGLRGGLMVDFNTMEIRPQRPEDMISKSMGCGKPSPWRGSLWEQFMREISVTRDGRFDEGLMRWRQKRDGY